MENFSEWFHDILENADITDSRYPIKGMAVWRPYGFQIRRATLNIFRDLMDKEHDETLFPLLIPEAELAKEALKKNVPVKDLILEYGLMDKEQLDKILDPYAMT